MAGKKQAPQKFEEPDEAEGWEDAVVETDGKDAEADARLRDWRDVERFRELKELRRLVDDDYGLEDIFHIPLKPRPEPAIPPKLPKGAVAKILPKLAPAPAAAPKPNSRHNSKSHAKAAPAVAAKPAAKVASKGHAKPAARAKAPAKITAKAKRR